MSRIKFYDSPAWRKKRREILLRDKHECVLCKQRGVYRRAVIVHHVLHYDRYPERALDDYIAAPDADGGTARRNLISVCRDCHETVCHPERMRQVTGESDAPTRERWD